jgi:penicillin amidase
MIKKNIDIWRDENGVPHIEADTLADLCWGQGYVHARDRGMQMLLMRILGQGRLCELLNDSEASLGIDIFFRKMNWRGHVKPCAEVLKPETEKLLQSYCEGVAAAWAKKIPWELKLARYAPEPWKIEDMITLSRMVGYLTLAQSQAEIERLFMEMVQAGVPEAHLEALFPGQLGGLDLDLLRQVTLKERMVPPHILWRTAAPLMMASNNWVIAGSKTASGKPIVANDPHLEVNRLPNVWCELVLKCGDRYAMGGTMPGFPGILTGRSRQLAWGVTYAFIDAVDSWVEKCKDGKYYRSDGERWIPFAKRPETIRRKKHLDYEVVFYENDHGVLDGDPETEGYYLATRWAVADKGAMTLESLMQMWHADSVEAGMDVLGRLEGAWSWVLGDTHGNIGFQMSGLAPVRQAGVSGLVPLPGWNPANDWQGFVPQGELPGVLNPAQGFFATANHDLNAFGKSAPINMPMGSYRADRINALLASRDGLTVEDMFEMHFDLFSRQAEAYMEILKPLLPDTEQGRILKAWDCCYDRESEGAFLFETFYRELIAEVFGNKGLGTEACRYLLNETGVFIDFYSSFDRVLLSQSSVWFGGESREALYRRVAGRVLDIPVRRWGDLHRFMMRHLFFGGKLPAFLGFDRGPVTGIGGRATIHQGQIYRCDNRETTFFPSYRIVSDLSADDARSNIAGGPSDRRFSKWYVSDLENWKQGRYKTLSAGSEVSKLPFDYTGCQNDVPQKG